MRTELTQDQIEFYRENGFIVLDEFLDESELEEWREAVDETVHKRGMYLDPEKRREKSGYYQRVFIQSLNMWKESERIRKLILDPRIGEMCCKLEGMSGYRVWHDQALIKEPWANQTSFHLDNPYWSFSSRHAVSIWVALDDATYQNGCLYFLPGTHKQARYDNVGIGPHFGALLDVYPEWAEIEAVAAPMKAGCCSFHNGLVAHGAGANATPGYRRAMTCGYMPDGATFNGKQNILTNEQIARLEIGDPLIDPEQNPLVFSSEG